MVDIDASPSTPTTPVARTVLPLRPLALLVGVGVVLLLAWHFDLGNRLEAVRGWIEGFGPWAPLVFVAAYALAAVAALPGSALTLAAGALFGSTLGVVLVSIGSTTAAAVSFLLARYLARDAAQSWLSRRPAFRRLDRMTEEHGAIVVALTRLVPIFPFNLLNYGFGLTAVRFGTYVFWSWIAMLPGTVVYVVGGDALTRGLAEGRIPWELIAVVVIVAAILVGVARRVRSRLAVEGEVAQAQAGEAGR